MIEKSERNPNFNLIDALGKGMMSVVHKSAPTHAVIVAEYVPCRVCRAQIRRGEVAWRRRLPKPVGELPYTLQHVCLSCASMLGAPPVPETMPEIVEDVLHITGIRPRGSEQAS